MRGVASHVTNRPVTHDHRDPAGVIAIARARRENDLVDHQDVTRCTGTFARRCTRYGSCDHMRSATNRLRGGSAAITIALQPSRSASRTMRFVALRVASTLPV